MPRAAAICALAFGSVVLTVGASQSLEVSSATVDEPAAPVPDPPRAAPLKIALGERLRGPPPVRNPQAKLRPRVMGAKIEDVVQRLNADPDIVRQFRATYGRGPDTANLLDAIAEFERSLLTSGSRFDRWLAGDETALSLEEQRGYSLFKSLGCVSCHQGRSIGGNLFQRHGIFRPLASPQPELLRVPSLRNVATTPPYFHESSAPTLEEPVRRMGVAQLNSTLMDPQVEAIAAYLRTLTGTFRGRPVGGPP